MSIREIGSRTDLSLPDPLPVKHWVNDVRIQKGCLKAFAFLSIICGSCLARKIYCTQESDLSNNRKITGIFFVIFCICVGNYTRRKANGLVEDDRCNLQWVRQFRHTAVFLTFCILEANHKEQLTPRFIERKKQFEEEFRKISSKGDVYFCLTIVEKALKTESPHPEVVVPDGSINSEERELILKYFDDMKTLGWYNEEFNEVCL
jgi:hypothetical protein